MATAFNLEDYTCRRDELPEVLWRVTHSNSQHELYPATGDIWAKDLSPISDEATLWEAAGNHFDWYCPEPSRFLSVFNEEDHALKWARRRRDRRGDKEVYITRIVIAMLPADALVFDATELSSRLEIIHPYSAHELIFLHRIPWQSLGRPCKLDSTTHDSYNEVSVPALVQSLQKLNDTVGPVISNNKLTCPLVNVRTGRSTPNKVHGKDYNAAMRGVVMAMVETLREGPGHSNEAEGRTTDPFIELSRSLCKDQQEKEDLLRKLAGCTDNPSAPSALPQPKLMKTASEVRRELKLQRTKANSQISARLVNILPMSRLKALGQSTLQDHTAQQSMQSERLESGSISVDSTPVVELVIGAGHSFIHQPRGNGGPEFEGSGEIQAVIHGNEGTETDIPDFVGLTLREG